MKKFIMIFALIGFLLTGFSQLTYSQTEKSQSKSQPQTQEKHEFTAIELRDLPDEVRTAAVKNDMAATIQSAEVKTLTSGEKIYRVALKSNQKGEYTLKFYADGKPYEK